MTEVPDRTKIEKVRQLLEKLEAELKEARAILRGGDFDISQVSPAWTRTSAQQPAWLQDREREEVQKKPWENERQCL
jgi:hypothetical protein